MGREYEYSSLFVMYVPFLVIVVPNKKELKGSKTYCGTWVKDAIHQHPKVRRSSLYISLSIRKRERVGRWRHYKH